MSGQDHAITASDGRRLCVRTFGDATAPALLLLHGTPGSRLVSPRITDPVIAAGLQLITLDRPGYGQSDPDYPRSLRAFADDIQIVTSALDVDSYVIAGVSGGGPHALAAAANDGCHACIILGGFAPVPKTGALPDGPNKLAYRIMRLSPLLFRIFNAVATFGAIKALSDDAKTEKLIAAMLAKTPPEDRDLISEPDAKAGLIDNLREAFKQGGKAVGEESLMLGGDWRHELPEIQVPIHWWHGKNDANVAYDDAKRFASTLAMINWHALDDGHSAWMHHWDEIVATITTALRR